MSELGYPRGAPAPAPRFRVGALALLAGVSLFLWGGIVLPVLLAQAAGKHKSPPPVIAGKVGQQLDEILRSLDLDTGGCYGSVLVAKKGKPILVQSYGFLDDAKKQPVPVDAQWDWASVTKQFTAAAVLRLAQERKLSLDDSIRKWYPELPESHQAVTLHHLLTHTSGLEQNGADGDPFSRENFILSGLQKMKVIAPPGEKWSYNNLAYGALAAVVEKVTEKPFEEWSKENLFEPFGMNDTTFIGQSDLDLERVPKDNRGKGVPFAYGNRLNWGYRGAGGVVSSTIDMLKWHQVLSSDKLLSKKTKEIYYKTVKDDYACGWTVKTERGDTFTTHSGRVGETVTYYLRALESDVVIALAYGYVPKEHPERTAMRLFEIVGR